MPSKFGMAMRKKEASAKVITAFKEAEAPIIGPITQMPLRIQRVAAESPKMYTPVTTIAVAVNIHTTTESKNGPHIALKSSDAGRHVLDAECAKPAVPTPAALENRERCIPITATPIAPPATPEEEVTPSNQLLFCRNSLPID